MASTRIAGMFLLVTAAGFAAAPSYFRDIRPVIQRQCQGCHQPNLKSSNLDLTSYEGFQSGGKHGPGANTLLGYVTGESKPQMPLGQPPLPPEQIELFKAWIAAGAKDDTPAEARAGLAVDKPIVYAQPPVINALAFSSDGKKLAVSGNREILIHALAGDAPPERLPGLSDRILSLVFSKDGSTLVAAGGTASLFGEIQIWDVGAGKLKRSLTLTGDTVFGVSLSPDASRVAVGCTDNSVRIVDAVSGKELFKIGNHENWVLGTIFGVDGKRIVSVGRDRAVHERAHHVGIANVADVDGGATTGRGDLRRALLHRRFGAATENHVRAASTDAFGDGSTDAARRPGHDGGLTRQINLH